MSSEEEQGPTASEEKQRPTALEEEIFGGTSSSSEDEEVIGSSDEGRRRAKGKKSAKSRSRPKGETISERVLEARRDFDEALERIKPRGGRRKAGQFDSTDPVDLDDIASNFRRKMENAAIADQENVDEGRPALVKHRMLPEVEEMLNKKHMHEILLDCGVLTAVKLWLEPLPNRSLPAAHLRKTLLELLRTLPIETDHLRESQIGRIVMFFARRPQETPAVQRLAKDLISRWSRPIMGDYDIGSSIEYNTTRELSSTMQSQAFKEVEGRLGDTGLSAHHKKLVMHMQKKSRSKKSQP